MFRRHGHAAGVTERKNGRTEVSEGSISSKMLLHLKTESKTKCRLQKLMSPLNLRFRSCFRGRYFNKILPHLKMYIYFYQTFKKYKLFEHKYLGTEHIFRRDTLLQVVWQNGKKERGWGKRLLIKMLRFKTNLRIHEGWKSSCLLLNYRFLAAYFRGRHLIAEGAIIRGL